MQRNNERVEFLTNMISQVKEIPVEEIISRELKLFRKGAHYLALCPFHPDNHLGSFVITPSKNIWWCFTCGHGGGGISFVMEYYDISFLDACFKLALEFSIITKEEAAIYSKKKYDEIVLKHIKTEVLSEKLIEEKVQVAPEDIIHNVYEAIANVCGLNDKHRGHLLKERGLGEGVLSDYFTFPTRKFQLADRIVSYIENKLKTHYEKIGLTEEQQREKVAQQINRLKAELIYVPGFYVSNGKLEFVSFTGIGFLIRDEKGHIKGIQIRKDKKKPNESRYVWFSSAFATRMEGCEGGAPSRSPGGFIKSKTGKNCLCITEGRFKAESLSEVGFSAIYLSGVSSWKSILPMIDKVAKPKQKVYLFYDADILGNIAVYEQSKKLANELQKKKYIPLFVLWKKNKGKGFDDLYINIGKDIKQACKIITAEKFVKVYQKNIFDILQTFNAETTRELKKDNIDTFCDLLQNQNENTFNL